MPHDDKKNSTLVTQTTGDVDFMQEMEDMRIRAKVYFPSDFDSNAIWAEAIEKKYGSFN